MQIDLENLRLDNPYYHAFIHIISGEENETAFNDILRSRENGQNVFEVLMTINGIHFDFCKIIDLLYKHREADIKNAPANLLREKFSFLEEKITNINDILEDGVNKLRNELDV